MKLVVTYMDSLATSKPFDLLARSRRNKVDRKIYKSRVGTTAISVKHARIICAVNLGVDTAHPLQDPNDTASINKFTSSTLLTLF